MAVEKGAEEGSGLERLLVRQRLEMDLLERWWAALAELERAAARLAKLEATKERQASRLLNGMTPRQRAFIARHQSLSWRSTHGKEWRAAVRRRQVWLHVSRRYGGWRPSGLPVGGSASPHGRR